MNFQSNLTQDKLKLPPISTMDDFLPTRTWAPQLDPPQQQQQQWKSPPYRDRNELSRDSSYKTCLYTTQKPLDTQQRGEKPYFQYTSASEPTYTTVPSPSSSSFTTISPTSRVDHDIEEVVRQCHTLCDNMVQHKSQFIQTNPPSSLDSSRPWLDDMIGRANEVLNALLRLRKHQMASEQRLNATDTQNETNEASNMPIWRVRSSSPSNPNRQRKRGKRPAFQGRCHSCNISETPEWRRGPDGARTLCNACGLHYAKLARKQQENRGMSTKLSPPVLTHTILPTG